MKIFLIVFCVGFSFYYMLANIFHTLKTPLTEDIIICRSGDIKPASSGRDGDLKPVPSAENDC